jgi:hypothetical protein
MTHTSLDTHETYDRSFDVHEYLGSGGGGAGEGGDRGFKVGHLQPKHVPTSTHVYAHVCVMKCLSSAGVDHQKFWDYCHCVCVCLCACVCVCVCVCACA